MRRHIQTDIPEATHARLRRRARAERRPVKDLVRDAVESYLRGETGSDPLTRLVGSVSIGGGWSQRKDWRNPAAKKRRALGAH